MAKRKEKLYCCEILYRNYNWAKNKTEARQWAWYDMVYGNLKRKINCFEIPLKGETKCKR